MLLCYRANAVKLTLEYPPPSPTYFRKVGEGGVFLCQFVKNHCCHSVSSDGLYHPDAGFLRHLIECYPYFRKSQKKF
ncbi:hypothetical protein SAMN04488072_10953 [Lentibacillus halodurans]|uniref:Uncharacterized protein n=1 Tax=Lentibacillus halodurans TaxID=237679 RepID=A0A1I0YZY6_9BACI|nr:hypothetical protein SAMN04488072_10953 [Lentibacillus halodurans]